MKAVGAWLFDSPTIVVRAETGGAVAAGGKRAFAVLETLLARAAGYVVRLLIVVFVVVAVGVESLAVRVVWEELECYVAGIAVMAVVVVVVVMVKSA